MLDILDISTTGLTANRSRMNAISNNISNMHTTFDSVDKNGDPVPYRRRMTMMKTRGGPFGKTLEGVQSAQSKDPRPFKEVYQPNHPHANAEGYVKMPNVDILSEYVDAMLASRAYEANVQVMNITKSMMNTSIGLLA